MNIIELAKDAGGHVAELPNGDAWLFDDDAMLERFATIVRAEPRELVNLTDDEMWNVFVSKDWTGEPLHLMSAVIAAFKEKQK